jgi:hypothetical protein
MNKAQLIDATLVDWQVEPEGKLAWREGEDDLSVRVWETKKGGGGKVIAVSHVSNDWFISLGTDWRKWINIAITYSQLSAKDFGPGGSEEEFWHYANAYEKFGTDPMFGGTKDGIYCHVGPEMVFCEYTDGRYDLFDQGVHAFAGTPSGLIDAYQKLINDIKLFGRPNNDD